MRQNEIVLILIPLQNEHVGMGISAKHTNFIQSARYCSKTCIFVIFGYNNWSASYWSTINTHTSSKWACWDGDMHKTYKLYFELKILLKNHHYFSFLAITIAVCQIQIILILIPLENQHVGMGICAKHTNFVQSKRYCSKTFIFVVFGYNNCSASNWSTFNTHTSSKWACWDGDKRQTHKFYSERKILLKNLHFCRFWL